MHVVVDSSVAVAWVLPDEPLHEHAIRFRVAIESGELEPVVAAHFGFEVRSALMQAAGRGRLDSDGVLQLVAAIDALEPTVWPFSGDDAALLELAMEHELSWADAHWVQTAVELDAPLVTADGKLARRVPASVAIVVHLEDQA